MYPIPLAIFIVASLATLTIWLYFRHRESPLFTLEPVPSDEELAWLSIWALYPERTLTPHAILDDYLEWDDTHPEAFTGTDDERVFALIIWQSEQ